MGKTIQEVEDEIIEEFSLFNDWMEKYEYIIELGKNLNPLKEEEKTEENRVTGCQSQVWIVSEFRDGRVFFRADSDAIITKGLVALILRVLSNRTPEEILNADLSFIDKIGMKEHLSPTRANGLVSMIKHIKTEATKYLKN
jgi:cysteine desulfuration protein SufE